MEELHHDMCNLVLPGRLVSDLDADHIKANMLAVLQYACCYWVEYLGKINIDERANAGLMDDEKAQVFLQEKLTRAMPLQNRESAARDLLEIDGTS
ncbi:hypothetical protein B0T25DRAFT_54292 [Lasiosphaeria hispida]|uniref:Uncharacterized protein n=1 Tax=Lasiosphaeria hispida TaxID=260671 RepID=A0AAJ0HW84_9PEZI|nr:hypothetical protein B0T25DRAFT_54292 [Lasiosphaeria hispida]